MIAATLYSKYYQYDGYSAFLFCDIALDCKQPHYLWLFCLINTIVNASNGGRPKLMTTPMSDWCSLSMSRFKGNIKNFG